MLSQRSSRWSPTPLAAASRHTRSHAYTYTLSCVRTASARTTGFCNFPTSPERAKQADRTTKQCVPTALCATTGYYFCAHLGGNGGGVSLHAITMDCLFLLLWTLPIPLVGCTSVKLLSTLLSWSIFKACCTYIRKIYTCTFKFSTCTCSLGEKTNKQLSLISRTKSATNLSNLIHCGEKWSQINLKCNSYFSRGTGFISPFWLPVFLLLVTCCYLSIYDFFFLSDAAHLLLTGLPYRFSQLFFQQQPRIKSWWVPVFSHLRMFLPAGCVPCL